MTNNTKEIELVNSQINEVITKFEKEYTVLADKSDELDILEEVLEDEYEKLDEKTWLNVLYEKLAKLSEGS